MDPRTQIDRALEAIVSGAASDVCPPRLADAVHYAVFPGGARVRPLLCLGVAAACGRPGETAVAAAVSIELMHCASLVHDDLPCFDDADQRRGKPSVHRAFGEPTAVLTGDALIVLAFDVLAGAFRPEPRALPAMVSILSRAVGMTSGLVAGQAWEAEPSVPLATYHNAKTGALFVAAAKAGAASAGSDPEAWGEFGSLLGLAYQVADDIRDASATPAEIGKPVGRDADLGRPSAIGQLGFGGAIGHLDQLVEQAIAAIPPCPRAEDFKDQVRSQVRWFLPERRAQFAA